MNTVKTLAATLLAMLVLASCSSPAPLNLNGVYGGVLSYQGTDFAVAAIDVSTNDGSVSGYGVLYNGSTYVNVSTTGSTTAGGGVSLRLTDMYGDWIALNGSKSGSLITGQWSTNVGAYSGSFRMAHEDDVGLLSTQSSSGGIADLVY